MSEAVQPLEGKRDLRRNRDRRLSVNVLCETCGIIFRPWRRTQTVCSHRCVPGSVFKSERISRSEQNVPVPRRISYSPIYRVWHSLVKRCTNPKNKSYGRYGARGITVCQQWLHGCDGLSGAEVFIADMGERPSPAHSIDRIDNDGNYEPGNCRWATREQQHNNRSDNLRVTYRGKEMTFAQAVRTAAIVTYATAQYRFRVSGWALEAAIETPVNGGSQ